MKKNRILILVLVIALALTLTGCQKKDYEDAMKLYMAGDYANAATAFKALGDYEDSAEIYKAAMYAAGAEKFSAGDYAGARTIFEDLGEFEDAPVRVKACSYAIAAADFEAGKYESAKARFEALKDYEDSAEMAKKCAYFIALASYENEAYETAFEQFKALGDFEDAAEYAAKLERMLNGSDLVGKWLVEMNFTQDMKQAFVVNFDDPTYADMNFTLIVKVWYELNEDGSYKAYVDEDSIADAYEVLEAPLRKIYADYMEDEVIESLDGTDMTLDDVYAYYGVHDIGELVEILLGEDSGIDAMLEETLTDDNVGSVIRDAVADKGVYTADDETISFASEDGNVTEARYLLDGDVLTVLGEAGHSLTFTRQK